MKNKNENYYFKMFYFNKNDNRLFVPKPVDWMGSTLNFAKYQSYIILAIVFLWIYFFFNFIC